MYSLHNHDDSSNSRLVDSINKVEDLLQYGFDLGLEGVAITDHETLNAHIRAIKFMEKKRAKKENETEEEKVTREKWEKFKLILGNEIYLCRNDLAASNYNKEVDSFYHFILLAVDEIGHKQLRQLSTRAYEHSFIKNRMRRVPTYYRDLIEIVKPNQGHIIASSACLGSYLDKKILQILKTEEKDFSLIYRWIEYIQDIFGKENFFIELQPAPSKDQIKVNKVLLQLSQDLNIPAIVTTDSHFLKKEDKELHKAFLLSKDGEREDIEAFYAYAYMMGEEEIHGYMDKYNTPKVVQQLLDNTRLIGDRIQQYDIRKPFKLPYLPSKEDIEIAKKKIELPMDLPEIWSNFVNSSEDADRVLLSRIIARCNTNPDYFWTQERIDRMTIELETVWNASKKQNIIWSKYFLQVADYIAIAWDKGDTLVGAGRGSGVGFYLNYLLDIIQIDPLVEKVPLYYWRFLNPERASILDIDSDVQSNRRNTVIEALQERYGEKRVIRVGTERTEGSKAAILTAARGLGIAIETAKYIASLIDSDRGTQRSLKVTYYGDPDNDIPPNLTFQQEVKKYPNLWEVAQKIEGLRSGASCHAGGVIIVDEDITETNSLVKLNSGEWITCWDLHESEELGNVKIDLLATLNLTRIRTCLDLLVQYGYVDKKPTLRETYESVLGVYNLDRTDSRMWEMLAKNEILSVFQFDTPQGLQGISLAKPSSVEELAALNSIMRLMASEKGAEQPLEKYARFKKNPTLWDKEMDEYNLTQEQKALLHKYLDYEYGICASQEDIMSMIQDPQLGGWSLKESDVLRKSIAKKDPQLYETLSQKYFKSIDEQKLDKNLCSYFWLVLVNMQRGYSFNLSHTLAYSIIGLQNMNLAARFPLIFWNTANLIVDSAGIDEEGSPENIDQEELVENIEEMIEEVDEEDNEDENEKVVETKEKVKRVTKNVDYGKTAKAIGRFMSYGINIFPPDINKSAFTFSPQVETNSIIYGLRGITRISNSIIKDIISKRPFASLEDFLSRVKLNKIQMTNLIKCGAFDNLIGLPREEIMSKYLDSIVDKKQKLTLQNMQMLINNHLIPEEMKFYAQLFLFNKFLKANKAGDYYELNQDAINFIDKHFDIDVITNGTLVPMATWDGIYKKSMEPMRIYLKENQATMLEQMNQALCKEMEDKYAKGNISHWEMESVSFYSHEHELAAAAPFYDDFFSLPEEPEFTSFLNKEGEEIRIYTLNKIIGTVIDKNKMKNTVTLLTPTGVVNVKVYKNQFASFDKQLSCKDASGVKHVIEKSWFSRGNLLMIQGIRRGNDFIPKKYRQSTFPIISKITNIDEQGHLDFQFEREEV